MKILTGKQIREADRYTVDHEPISSIDLMERAAVSMAAAIARRFAEKARFAVFAGKGNNGGDGLAIARLLHDREFTGTVHALYDPAEGSEEFRINHSRLPAGVNLLRFDPEHPPEIPEGAVVIDAILGTGTSGAARGIAGQAIGFIRSLDNPVVSVDIPSGMSTEFGNAGLPVVTADVTLTVQFPKLSMLLPEAGDHGGEIEVIDIGLNRDFLEKTDSPYFFTTKKEIRSLCPKRNKFDHKGMYGHALIIAGSAGMTGAAILSVSAALRSGCGLVTAHLPESGQQALNLRCPSAMTVTEAGSCFSRLPESLRKYTAVGIGPGLGQAPETVSAFGELMARYRYPMVIDADALNILAAHPDLVPEIPPGSILTPHIGELRRLLGEWTDEEEKLGLAGNFAAKTNTVLVIKGAYTAVVSPEGTVRFNSTGNPGMAKGGSGDILTGLLTGLLAKGMAPSEAAVLGVYLHGEAGDRAREKHGEESMDSADLPPWIRF